MRMKGILILAQRPQSLRLSGRPHVVRRTPRPRVGGRGRTSQSSHLYRSRFRQRQNHSGVPELHHDRQWHGPTDEVDPFGRKQDVSKFTLDQIRYWVQTILTFPPDAPVVVKEVPCVKAGCPPVETAIMVFLKNEPPRTFKILARINEVTFDHVYNLIENPLPCC